MVKILALIVFLLFTFINWWTVVQPFEAVRSAFASGLNLSLAGFSAAVFLAAWGGHLRNLCVTALILAAAWGFGGRMSAWLGGKRSISGLTRIAAGLGVLGMAVFGLGLAGMLFGSVAALLVLTGILQSPRSFPGLLASFPERFRRLRGDSRGPENRLLLSALAVMGVSCFFMSLGPEGGWDAVFYHVRLPKLYSMAHKVSFISSIFPANYPQGVEMLYLLGWMGGGEGAAKLVNFSFWLLSGGAVWRLSRHLGAGIPLRALALALTMPISGALASEGYIDLGLTFFELTAVAEVLRGRAGTAGFLLGCAMATKYTGIFALVAALAAGGTLGMGAGKLGAMGVCSLIPLAPWLFKNAWFTGDPAAPFLSGFLGRLDWVDGISQEPLRTVHGLMPATVGGAMFAVLTGLWRFLNNNVFGVYSPFVIGILPVLALRSHNQVERTLKVYGLVFTLLVLVLAPDGRYWQPAAFALCVPMAASWTRIAGERMYLRVIIGMFASVSALSGALYHPGEMNRSLPGTYSTALGLNTKESFYAVHRAPDGYWRAVSFINSAVPRGESVAVVSDVQAYLIDRRALFDSDAQDSRRWLDNLALVCRSPRDWDRAFRKWKCRTVLYLNGRAAAVGHPRDWTPEETRIFAGFWNARANRVFRSAECSVYELGPASARRPRPDLPGPQERWLLEMQRTSRWPGDCGRVYGSALLAGAESGRLHMIYGGLMANAGALGEGVSALERAVALAPDEAAAWYWLTAARLRRGDRARARKSFDRGFALEPENALSGALGNAVR